ncbi:MAG: response regulator [Gammaproteobacteria bacterium]|nr:response regulator [Gammaproteobacteria bacterium]
MNGIIGMADLLLDTNLTREQFGHAHTISTSADSLLTIINDILDFTQMEGGKLEMEKIDFDIHIAVERATDISNLKAAEKKLRLSFFVDPEVPSMLRGDPGRLKQVLINLTNNAIKFTNDGEVSINVTLAEKTDSHATVHFAVRDTGIGISPDRIDCMFQSFTQVDGSTTRKNGGVGLGLTICKQLVDLMGGEICVESEEGKGSTFWFTAKMERTPLDQEKTSFELGNVNNIRVLVIDDNKTSTHNFSSYLESMDFRVEDAASLVEAIKMLNSSADEGDPFKIALIDHYTLKSDMKTLCHKIKANPLLRDLRLILLASVGKYGEARYFRSLGFDAYLVRPVEQAELLDCIKIVIGKHASIGEDTTSQMVTRYTILENHKRSAHILLVEDNVVNKKITLHILEKKLGYQVDSAGNGKEAIKQLERFDYDLVLMDCQMPVMDGYDATRAIRNHCTSVKNDKIPIIALTANTMKGDREKCLGVGMDDYLSKPVKMQDLANAIERNIMK